MERVRRSLALPVAVIVVALLLAAEVARLTVSAAVAEDRPQLALDLAPDAPQVLASVAMAQIGEAAAKGGDPSEETMMRLRRVAAAAPLRLEPFLVQAALAQRAGDYARAETLLRQARLRDPRSPAALYLLGDVSIQQGKTLEGLQNLAALSRILPETSVQMTSALAQYARTPGARSELPGILADNPQLKKPLLIALAADPDNADLILTLAGPDARSTDRDSRNWQSRLLRGFVQRGQYDNAYRLWRRFIGMADGPKPLLFNGEFRKIPSLPPFGWELVASAAGFAEVGNGSLRILYYGREDSELASQLLLLPPGRYRFRAPIKGRLAPGALAWTLRCREGASQLLEQRVGEGGTSVEFAVPSARCDAQLLQLSGIRQDMPQDSDVLIGPARIERVGE